LFLLRFLLLLLLLLLLIFFFFILLLFFLSARHERVRGRSQNFMKLGGVIDTCLAILKMVTGINFSISGINSGHHYLPTYQILMILDNVEFLPPILMPCFGSHFENEITFRSS
jgi:ABC-type Na+ efflux pump permease subunit